MLSTIIIAAIVIAIGIQYYPALVGSIRTNVGGRKTAVVSESNGNGDTYAESSFTVSVHSACV